MKANQILKWIFLLSIVGMAMNGILYSNTGERGVFIGIISAAVLGVVSGIGILITRKR
ncbi:hypothetical protein [Paenibacillus selenitireducens]|uniref:hypothetical protein n=1 Tax=Paenibacillus selenitireducens TaxID=1324314 RepID=UPI001301FBDB|nr:hypothetical protein [Paenibacillus selenitireducens]